MTTIALQTSGITPGYTVNDIQRSIKFYTEGLGFSIESEDKTDGVTRFVMLRAGEAQLGLGQDDFAKGRDRAKGIGMRLWISTSQDMNALASQLKAAGFALDSEPAPLPWGPVGFGVTDPDGFKLTISNEK